MIPYEHMFNFQFILMNILIVNSILFTSEKNVIPEVKSIKETLIYTMCMGFVTNGHQLTLAAAEDYRPVAKEEYDFEILFFKSVFTGLFLPSVLPFSIDLYKYLRANHKKYDLVVSSDVFSFSSLFVSLVCQSKTVIWHEMKMHQKKFKMIPSKMWYNIVVPLFLRKVRCVIPRSQRARLFISQYMKNVSEEIADHGVSISRFGFSKDKERQVISSSQLIPRKNIESLILIFSKLIKIEGFSDIKLLVAGDGVLRKSLEELVGNLNLQDNVLFLGFLNHQDLNEAIKKSYAFMINTLRDNNMVSIPESIVSGTPVITNLMPDSADYIIKGNLGIAKDNWDEYDLKEIIEKNAFYVDNCMKYRERLSNNFSAKTIVDVYSASL